MVFSQPKHSSMRFLFFWLRAYPACRVVRLSIALPPLRARFCATCGVTQMFRHSRTNSAVSKPLSPATVTAERYAALEMLQAIPGSGRVTVAGDKGFDTAEIMTGGRDLLVPP